MRHLVMVLVLGAPALALAQSAPPPSEPPPPPPADPAAPPPPAGPYNPNAGAGPYSPPPPAGPYNGPAPYQPQPYGQPYQAPPTTAASFRNGMTFEANLGIGWLRSSGDNSSSETSDLGVGGLCLGVGGWVNPKTAITARIAGATIFDSNGGYDARLTNAFFGVSAQYWVDDHIWLGGGAGLSVLALTVDGGGQTESDSINGFGLDMRAGYTFSQGTDSTWNASFELTPGFYSENNSDGTVTGIAILLGYQHL